MGDEQSAVRRLDRIVFRRRCEAIFEADDTYGDSAETAREDAPEQRVASECVHAARLPATTTPRLGAVQ